MIKKIKKINIEKLILISTMILLIGVPLITIFSYTCYCLKIQIPFSVNRAYLLWYGVPFLFILYILDLIINKKKINYIDILIYLLIILGILSTIYAVDINTSIYGENVRNEGLLSLLSYYFILLNLKNMTNRKYKKIIIKTIISLGIVQIIYGILQVYTNWSIINRMAPHVAIGLNGNPNFFGSYMVIFTSFTFSMYMLKQERKYLILSVIFFIGLCLCYSTGPFITFLLVVIFFIIFYRKQIKWKNLLKILLLLILTYFFTNYSVKYVHNNILKDKVNPNSTLSLAIKDFDLSNFGNGRLKIWKNSLPLVKKYWVIGAGLDNFGKVYGAKNGYYYDKAHNVYLQIAVTNGIFALIVYLVLMAIIFFKGLKIKESIYISMLMAFIGYSIQAFANISVVEVAPTFFVICGLLLGRIQKSKKSLVINDTY